MDNLLRDIFCRLRFDWEQRVEKDGGDKVRGKRVARKKGEFGKQMSESR